MTNGARSRRTGKKIDAGYGNKQHLRELTHRLVMRNKRRLAKETPAARKARYALQRRKRADRKRHEKEFH